MSETLSLRTDLPEEDFKKLAEEKTGRFCSELGVRVHSISFKKLKGRWGSCTGDGKITVNTFLRFLPDRLIDYILFHEVAHRIEKGHNRNFHAIIRRKFDDNVMLEKTLAAYWYLFSQSRFILE